ncbi:type I-E CRISPR-associated protein Cas5/CasD [Streptomyces bluensis]|uniref:Type I-E CRISPR-associated protein Cas5/CasD n=1 Tax=Streptomyces bluensis TaxID=33897 RepID=A0ABW6UNE4_9ACTN
MTSTEAILLLRLAGPLQSWGGTSDHNRRETRPQPTKSGVLGLLAAAAGRHRGEPISDLVGLRMGIRVDQPGSLLRDYHTASDYRGRPLLSSQVNAQARQKGTSPAKHTHVTQRFYLQDAVFVAALQGPVELVDGLESAVRNPAFPLALGRRSCPPSHPLVLGVRQGTQGSDLEQALRSVQWQAAEHERRAAVGPHIRLAATIEDPAGDDTATDVPLAFDFRAGGRLVTRHVRHTWLTIDTGQKARTPRDQVDGEHDPFELLG